MAVRESSMAHWKSPSGRVEMSGIGGNGGSQRAGYVRLRARVAKGIGREPASGATWRGRCELSLRVALRELPGCVAPVTSLLVERPYGVSAERRCKVALVPLSDEKASDIGVSLWPSRSEGVSQRLRVVAPVRSLPCIARQMITFITSFELEMHPNVSKNSMWYSNT
ncbi:hypothetical protein F2Q69_00059784 [Brassica cretica]|uniref:Uncharacterized protein n=1 Tax=Brassica cretica TaxID=69181 RepID=A0A8S9RPA0_BRACR|nr:hypothetical protein F2Q69_00059784 [Brassica cretica]